MVGQDGIRAAYERPSDDGAGEGGMDRAEHHDGGRPAGRRAYVPAIGPRLRILLVAVLGMLAVLAANSAYLASVTFLEWATGNVYQNWLYQWMFLVHLVLGGAFVLPFVVFGLVHMANTRHRKNRRAVRVGYALFAASLAVLVSGGLLVGLRTSGAATWAQ